VASGRLLGIGSSVASAGICSFGDLISDGKPRRSTHQEFEATTAIGVFSENDFEWVYEFNPLN
jgi:hypothetical protein